MGKTSNAVKQRWNAKNYDRLGLTVPKGRKSAIEQHAQRLGKSVNAYICDMIQADMGMTDDQWREKPAQEEPDEIDLPWSVKPKR